MTSDRLNKLEETLSHQSALIDELNSVVTNQSSQIDKLNSRVALLMTRAAEQEADSMSGAPVPDAKPPHW